jgi:O-acetyl-ADP-ribose deacetylase (regulator of RNase III)
MIRVTLDSLLEAEVDAIVRPIRTDHAPTTALSRDLANQMGELPASILERSGLLPVGAAILTPAPNLPSDYLIHVVVLSEEEPQTSVTVRKALGNALARAGDLGLESVALPPLGIGVGLTEPEAEASVLVEILQEHLDGGGAPRHFVLAVTSGFEEELFGSLIRSAGYEWREEG